MRTISLIFVVANLHLAISSQCYRKYEECLPDLSGYTKCEEGKMEIIVKCPGNTRCSCFHHNHCDMVPNKDGDTGIKEEDICQILPKPFPVKEIIHLTYKKGGYEWYQNEWDDEFIRRFHEEGEVKQDLTQMRAAYRWGGPEHPQFSIVIPDNNDGFIKFHGNYNPNRCRRTTLKTFPYFAREMEHLRLKERSKMKNGKEKQMWYNEVFRYEYGEDTAHRWTVISDPVKKHVVPVRYRHSYTATEEVGCCDWDKYVDYKEVEVPPNANIDHWFQVPEFCP